MRGVSYLVGAILVAHPAVACSCVDGLTACGQLSTAKVAFIGTVIEGTESTAKGANWGDRPATLRVETIVRGLEPRTVEIKVNPAIMTSCYFPMGPGERWLVLGGLSDGTVSTGGCTGSQIVREGNSSINDAIDSFTKGPNLVRVEVRKYQGRDTRWKKESLLPNTEIVLRGSGREWAGKTNDEGQLHFSGLPQGEYEFEVNSPGLSLGSPEDTRWSTPEKFSPKIKVSGLGCIDAPLTLWPDQGISGTVRDEQGRPLADVNVGAFEIRSGNRASSSSFRTAVTDSQGKYNLPRMPNGSYVVGANAEEGYDGSPYRAKYYPAAITSLAAARIVVDGTRQDGVDISMERPRRSIALAVRVVFNDGKAAPNAFVSITRDDTGNLRVEPNEANARTTNAEGIVRLRLWEGDNYTFSAFWSGTDPVTKRTRSIDSDSVRAAAFAGVSPVVTLKPLSK